MTKPNVTTHYTPEQKPIVKQRESERHSRKIRNPAAAPKQRPNKSQTDNALAPKPRHCLYAAQTPARDNEIHSVSHLHSDAYNTDVHIHKAPADIADKREHTGQHKGSSTGTYIYIEREREGKGTLVNYHDRTAAAVCTRLIASSLSRSLHVIRDPNLDESRLQ